jgi:hypothetical protein
MMQPRPSLKGVAVMLTLARGGGLRRIGADAAGAAAYVPYSEPAPPPPNPRPRGGPAGTSGPTTRSTRWAGRRWSKRDAQVRRGFSNGVDASLYRLWGLQPAAGFVAAAGGGGL